jgi:hypothetical protein
MQGDYYFECGSVDAIAQLPPFPQDLLDRLGTKYAGEPGDYPEADPKIIAAAMAVIPNADVGWDNWKTFGMAIWRATGGAEQGFDAWDAWSTKSSKYDADTTRKEWQAITNSPPTRIGAGTIIYHANTVDPHWRDDIKDAGIILYADAPLRSAEVFLRNGYLDQDAALLRHYRGTYYEWDNGCYRECDPAHLRSHVYHFLQDALTIRNHQTVPFNPDLTKVRSSQNVLEEKSVVDN